MSRRMKCVIAVGAVLACVACAAAYLCLAGGIPSRYSERHAPPRIRPDYSGIIIPPNIAPLNFIVEEPAAAVRARITGQDGGRIDIAGDGAKVIIPPSAWKELLRRNRGKQIAADVYVKEADGRWTKFDSILNTVSQDAVDSHLVYRLVNPSIHNWGDLGLYQRNLETFDEREIIHRQKIQNGCVNCHVFLNNNPDTFFFHVRSEGGPYAGGMVLVRDGKAVKVDTRTKFNPSPTAYSSWHPSGRIVASSVNRIKLFTHGAGPELRDQLDLCSNLVTIDMGTMQISPMRPAVDPMNLDTFPAWSPDGKFLYYCNSRAQWPNPQTTNAFPGMVYRDIMYDLMRISYDIDKGTWGQAEIVLSHQQAGKSILEPRISPDGRYAMLSLCEYGNVAVFQPGCTLYLLDLQSRELRRMSKEVSTGECDSWHCWSSSGRWFVFASKRGDGMVSRPYLAYFDRDGREHKAFLVPQEDPAYYDSYLKSCNLPELVTGPVTISERELVRVITEPGPPQAVTGATPRTSTRPAQD
ncbi:MAG: TolB family protein [Phycisphaerae bacterium]